MASDEMLMMMELVSAMPSLGGQGLDTARAALDGSGALPLDDDVTAEATTIAGRPAEWVTAGSIAADAPILLYFHGGGYCLGSLDSHRRHVANLSRAAQVRCLHLDYRLAPEHPFPAAITDAVAAYDALLASGENPDHVAVGGDSAGGGLTMATMISLRDAGSPLPAAAALLSPWVDLALTGGSHQSRAEADPLIDAGAMEALSRWYLGDTAPDDPLASPVYADLTGLPPTLIDCGDAEVLLDDSVMLAERMQAAGVEVDHQVWPEMIHVFQVFAGMAPEAQAGVDRIGEFLGRHLH
ncbi:MAG: alpha/beta hydrolase [Acidimicrobiales bacterium]